MHLGYHGGQCCGIKTIFRMGASPKDICGKLEPYTTQHSDGGKMSSENRFFKPAAPREDAKTRLHRYIHYLEQERRNGIIEVVVANNVAFGEAYNQTGKWKETLLEFGFKLVNECKNSNSGNIVSVYHRNSGEVPKLEPLPDTTKEVPKKVSTCSCGDPDCDEEY